LIPSLKKIMYKLESYFGTAGPIGPKKYWEYPWTLANLRLESGMSIMDAGCGKFPVQFLLADLGMQVTGVDFFENVGWHGIDRSLTKRFGSRIEYYRESMDNLRFPDNVFDRILVYLYLSTLGINQFITRKWSCRPNWIKNFNIELSLSWCEF